MKFISVILPVKNEAGSLIQLNSLLQYALSSIGSRYEVIYVNDASTDDSASILKALKDSTIKIINIDKSCGKSSAMQAGFDNAKGNIIITLDADLENDPRDIEKLIEKLDEGYDVVCGKRVGRPKNLNLILSRIGNLLFRALFRAPVDDMACNLSVYKKAVLDKIVIRGSFHRYLPVILHIKGARIGQVEVRYFPRKHGRSKYRTFGRMISTLKDLMDFLFFRKMILENTKREYKIRDIC
jgi:glycosyltransferase involved in cell wall biosynthesis